MSAFIVTDYTITAICEGLRRYNIGVRNPEGREIRREDYPEGSEGYFAWLNEWGEKIPWTEFTKIGQALVDMNYKSVNYRYSESEEPHKFEPSYIMDAGKNRSYLFRNDYNAAQIMGAVNCYEYQSCECPEWEESGIPAALKRLVYELARELAVEKYGEESYQYDIRPDRVVGE